MPFDPLELPDYFTRHGRDFQAATERDYERMAEASFTIVEPCVLDC